MGLLLNFKLSSLRRGVANTYKPMLDQAVKTLGSLPKSDFSQEYAIMLAYSYKAITFASTMDKELFDSIFGDDIASLDELKYRRFYEVMLVWYSWPKSGGDVQFTEAAINTILKISPETIRVYYNALSQSSVITNLALYRWCILIIGHPDPYYDSLHEKSPHFEIFENHILNAESQAENSL